MVPLSNKLSKSFLLPHSRMGKLEIMDDRYISSSIKIDLTDDVKIGLGVIISREVLIYTHEHHHRMEGLTHVEMTHMHGVSHSPLIIHDDVYIGARAMILNSCQVLGQGCVVAAGAIVANDVQPYAIVGGIPARHIGHRPGWVYQP